MSDLKKIDKLKLEKMFEMGQGYVLDFGNISFAQFVLEYTEIDIDEKKYFEDNSGSKANRLRKFWELESNYKVAKLISAMLEYKVTKRKLSNIDIDFSEQELYNDCLKIAENLKNDSVGEDIDALELGFTDEDFKTLSNSIRDSIENGEPSTAIDRLHTYIVKFVKKLCTNHSIEIELNKPLHSYFGEYVKHLKMSGLLESEMTERIMKSNISILESFNHVRNNQSFAHDNIILNKNESMLIFKNVSSVIKFIQSIDNIEETKKATVDKNDDLPF